MAKRDIKAKRWLRKQMNREYFHWSWSRSATGRLVAIAGPFVVRKGRAVLWTGFDLGGGDERG